jgi:hypothetical protein
MLSVRYSNVKQISLEQLITLTENRSILDDLEIGTSSIFDRARIGHKRKLKPIVKTLRTHRVEPVAQKVDWSNLGKVKRVRKPKPVKAVKVQLVAALPEYIDKHGEMISMWETVDKPVNANDGLCFKAEYRGRRWLICSMCWRPACHLSHWIDE